MTTPERFRRRQHIEAFCLIAVGIAMIFQSWYFHTENRQQEICLTENFQELSVALNHRARLSSIETEQNKALWMIYARAAGLVKDKENIRLTPEQQEKFNRRLVDQLLEYRREINKIERQRENRPLPPYPVGTCQE